MSIKELYEKKGRLIEQLKELSKAVADATDAAIAQEKSGEWDKCDADYESVNKQIDIALKTEAIEAKNADYIEPDEKKVPQTKDEILKSPEYEKAFDSFLRTGGVKGEDAEVMERASAFSTTDNVGGYTIPETTAKRVLLAKTYFGGMLDRSLTNWFQTKDGGTFNLPAANDTAQEGYVVGEVVDLNTSAQDITFTNITLGAYQYTSGLVKVSNALIQDSMFDFLGWLSDTLAIRYWRGLNTLFTTGDGSSTLTGIVTGATKGEDALVRGLTRDNLLDLYHSVDPAYRNSPFCRWMLNDSTLKTIKAIVQSATYNESPLWQPSMRVGEPDTIEGKKFLVNQAMESIHPTYKPVLFGDFKQFLIREVLPMKIIRLNERFADTNQVGFALLGRYDSKLGTASNSNPVKFIRNATT